MKKQKGKQIKLIISLISVGIFVYSYFVVYEKYAAKTVDAYNEIDIIQKQMKERAEMLIKEEEVLASLEEINRQKQEIMDTYPVYIAKEDNFMFVEKLQKNTKINIMSVDVSDNTSFYETILPAVDDETDDDKQENKDSKKDAKNDTNKDTKKDAKKATMNGLVNAISMTFLTNYDGIKELSEYIRNYPEPTVIDRLSISYDSSTGALAGNLVLKRFSLTGTGKEYEGTHIEGIDIGTDNIFGTNDILTQDKDENSEPEGN